MKKILYTLGIICSIFFSSCNESTEIEIPEALPTIEDDGADVTFTPDQLKLPGKKGVVLKLSNVTDDVRENNLQKIQELGAFWNYTWGWAFGEGQPEEVEFLPMFWGKGSVAENTLSYLKEEILNGRCKKVLGFNEPDGKNQANMTVEQALELWPQIQALKVPLGSPAVTDNQDGKDWLDDFMQGVEERGYRVDFICVHNYGGPNASSFMNDIQYFIDKYKRPILITEFAVADWGAQTIEENDYSPDEVLAFMKEVLPWLEQNDNILGYAWFQYAIDTPHGYSSALYDENGELTACGKYYRDLQPGGEDGSDGGNEGEGGNEENPSVDPNNLVKNCGFEDEQSNWINKNNSAEWETDENNVINGNVSLRLKKLSSGNIAISQYIDVEVGKTYKYGFKGRIQTAAGPEGSPVAKEKFSLNIRNASKGNAATSINTSSNSTNPNYNNEYSGTVTIKEEYLYNGGENDGKLEIYFYKPAAGVAYVDDVYFIEVID